MTSRFTRRQIPLTAPASAQSSLQTSLMTTATANKPIASPQRMSPELRESIREIQNTKSRRFFGALRSMTSLDPFYSSVCDKLMEMTTNSPLAPSLDENSSCNNNNNNDNNNTSQNTFLANKRNKLNLVFDRVDFLEKEKIESSQQNDDPFNFDNIDDVTSETPLSTTTIQNALINTLNRPKPLLLQHLETRTNLFLFNELKYLRNRSYVFTEKEAEEFRDRPTRQKRKVRFMLSPNRAALLLLELTDEREVLFMMMDGADCDRHYFRMPTRDELQLSSSLSSDQKDDDSHETSNQYEQSQEVLDFNHKQFFRYSFFQLRLELNIAACREGFCYLVCPLRICLFFFTDDLYSQVLEVKKVMIRSVLECGSAGVMCVKGLGKILSRRKMDHQKSDDENNNAENDNHDSLKKLFETVPSNSFVPFPFNPNDVAELSDSLVSILTERNPALANILEQKQKRMREYSSSRGRGSMSEATNDDDETMLVHYNNEDQHQQAKEEATFGHLSWTGLLSFEHQPCLSLIQLLSQQAGTALILPQLTSEHFICLRQEVQDLFISSSSSKNICASRTEQQIAVDDLMLEILDWMLLYKKGSKRKELISLANQSTAGSIDISELEQEIADNPLSKRLLNLKKSDLGENNQHRSHHSEDEIVDFATSPDGFLTVFFEREHVRTTELVCSLLLQRLKDLQQDGDDESFILSAKKRQEFLNLWKKVVNLFSSLLQEVHLKFSPSSSSNRTGFLFPPSASLRELRQFVIDASATTISFAASHQQNEDSKKKKYKSKKSSSHRFDITLELFISIVRMSLLSSSSSSSSVVRSLFTKVIVQHNNDSHREQAEPDQPNKDEDLLLLDELELMASLDGSHRQMSSSSLSSSCTGDKQEDTTTVVISPSDSSSSSSSHLITFFSTKDVYLWQDLTDAALEISLLNSSSIALTLLTTGLELIRKVPNLKTLATFVNLVSVSFGTTIFGSSSSSLTSASSSSIDLVDLFNKCKESIETRLVDLVADANEEIRRSSRGSESREWEQQAMNLGDDADGKNQADLSNNNFGGDSSSFHSRSFRGQRSLPPPMSCAEILAFLQAARKLPNSFSISKSPSMKKKMSSGTTTTSMNLFSIIEPVARDAIGSRHTPVREVIDAAIFLAQDSEQRHHHHHHHQNQQVSSSSSSVELDTMLLDLLLARILPNRDSSSGIMNNNIKQNQYQCPFVEVEKILPLMKFFALALAATTTTSSASPSGSSVVGSTTVTNNDINALRITSAKVEEFLQYNDAANRLTLAHLDKVVKIYLKFLHGSTDGQFIDGVFKRWTESALHFPDSNLIMSVLVALRQIKGDAYLMMTNNNNNNNDNNNNNNVNQNQKWSENQFVNDLVFRSVEIVKGL